MKLHLIVPFAAVSLFALSALAADPPGGKPKECEISFARMGGIQDWRADGEKALYVQGRDRQWYHATLMSPCIGLNFAEHIGFVTEPNGSLDKFSAILVDHRECNITSLVKSDLPPKGK